MAVILQRALVKGDDVTAGQYASELITVANGRRVTIGCPLCGQRTELADGHVIDRAGRVTPAFHCPALCGLFEWLQLADWGPQ
jgi:hypothetical protein